MEVFLVIPAYNEEKNILNTLNELSDTRLTKVFVDDGSSDDTARILSKYPNAILLKHKTNLGKGAAMRTGADFSFKNGADAVVFMDSDGQHKVEDLDKFINALEKGYEIIFGVRKLTGSTPSVRRYGNRIGSEVVKTFFGIKIPDLLCGYRGVTKEGYRKLNLSSSDYSIETEMVAKTALKKLKFGCVDVQTVYLDNYKGVTIIDAAKVLLDMVSWRLKV